MAVKISVEAEHFAEVILLSTLSIKEKPMSDLSPFNPFIPTPEGNLVCRLPMDKGSDARRFAAIMLVPAGAFSGFAGFVAYQIAEGPAGAWVVFGVMVSVMTLIAGIPLVMSLWLFFGHTVLTLYRDRLATISWLGFLPLAFGSRRRDKLRRFVVSRHPSGQELVAVCSGAKPFGLVWHYPEPTLLRLGQALADRLGGLPVETEDLKFTGHRPQPIVRSRITVREQGGHRKYRIPPCYARTLALVPFLFGVLWCSGLAFITYSYVFPRGVTYIAPGTGAALLFFWVVGLSLLLGCLHYMLRHVVFEVGSAGLSVQKKGLIHFRPLFFAREEIKAVHPVLGCREDSQTKEDCDGAEHALVIALVNGKTRIVRGLYGLHHLLGIAEYEWLATELNHRVGLPQGSGLGTADCKK